MKQKIVSILKNLIFKLNYFGIKQQSLPYTFYMKNGVMCQNIFEISNWVFWHLMLHHILWILFCCWMRSVVILIIICFVDVIFCCNYFCFTTFFTCFDKLCCFFKIMIYLWLWIFIYGLLMFTFKSIGSFQRVVLKI